MKKKYVFYILLLFACGVVCLFVGVLQITMWVKKPTTEPINYYNQSEAVFTDGEGITARLDKRNQSEAVFTDGEGITARLDKRNGNLIFEGSGIVKNCREWLTVSSEEKHSVKTIIFKDGITGIGVFAFSSESMGYTYLQEVIFEGDIGTIDFGAFYGNQNLITVQFLGNCSEICNAAFGGCQALDEERVLIPDSCEVREWAFVSDMSHIPTPTPSRITDPQPLKKTEQSTIDPQP